MAFTLCRAIAAPLLFFNFSLYIIVATIAGWALNETINHGGNWRGEINLLEVAIIFIHCSLGAK